MGSARNPWSRDRVSGRSSGGSAVVLAADVRAAFDAAVRALEDAGARFVEVELPEAGRIYDAFGVIQRAEALDVHRRAGLYPSRRAEYGADVLGRLDAASSSTSLRP